ncbi:hypothetical protein [Sulfurimonas sp.]
MNKHMLKVPVELLEKLLENCSDEAKSEFVDYIRRYKSEIDKKGHEAEGFYIDDSGKIKFDDTLYMEAVYRGKVETYEQIYKKSSKEVSHCKKMLKGMVDKQLEFKTNLADKMHQQKIF